MLLLLLAWPSLTVFDVVRLAGGVSIISETRSLSPQLTTMTCSATAISEAAQQGITAPQLPFHACKLTRYTGIRASQI